jgi:hypothetical protein
MTTGRHEALRDENVKKQETTFSLPYDCFKRDVYKLALHMYKSRDWAGAKPCEEVQEELQNEPQDLVRALVAELRQLTSDIPLFLHAPQQYERVFKTDLGRMKEYQYGPHSPGMFLARDKKEHVRHVLPGRLRRLFLRLLDSDPSKRPTAQEAVEELRAIRDA